MRYSSCYPVVSIHYRVQLALLVFLLFFAVGGSANHDLTVSPSQPTSSDSIVIHVTGDWPSGGTPALSGWNRSDKTIRIDAFGVLPGIETPIVPYQFNVDIGRLPPGQYHVDYFIEFLAAPGPPPGGEANPPLPNASIDFEVVSGSVPIPALSAGTVVLLSVLLLLIPLVAGDYRYTVFRLRLIVPTTQHRPDQLARTRQKAALTQIKCNPTEK